MINFYQCFIGIYKTKEVFCIVVKSSLWIVLINFTISIFISLYFVYMCISDKIVLISYFIEISFFFAYSIPFALYNLTFKLFMLFSQLNLEFHIV